MKYAIFSDIHSNLESLKVFLTWLLNQPEVKPVCLGDVIGYGARPNECVTRLQDHNIPSVMGNHDYAVNFIQERKNINEYALQAMQWYDKVLTPKIREVLRRLPLSMVIDNDFAVTHADFSNPAGFPYITTSLDAHYSFAALPTPLGFFGHTHIPGVLSEDPRLPESERITGIPLFPDPEPIRLDSEVRYLINPGSLGQPRDGDPRSSFVVYDSDQKTVTFHRLEYDTRTEAKKILEAGLPEFLAERLFVGY